MPEKILELKHWSQALQSAVLQFKDTLLNHLPNLVAALGLILLGLIFAKIAKYIGLKLSTIIFKFVSPIRKVQTKFKKDWVNFSKLLGNILYWVVLIYFLFMALKISRLPGTSTLLEQFHYIMPNLLSGITIILLGFIFGALARETVYSSIGHQEGKDPHFIAKATYLVVVVLFILWGVGQVGIKISILTNFLNIILTCILGSVALGFGIGSSSHVSNLLAAFNLKRNFCVGERIKISDVNGIIVDITPTALKLETSDGIVIIPAKLTNDNISYKV